jgi:hypothetical protein
LDLGVVVFFGPALTLLPSALLKGLNWNSFLIKGQFKGEKKKIGQVLVFGFGIILLAVFGVCKIANVFL